MQQSGQGVLPPGIVFLREPPEGPPVLAFGFLRVGMQNTRLPTQLPPKGLGPPGLSVREGLPLTGVGQLIPVPTGGKARARCNQVSR